MIVSWNWLKQYVELDMKVDELERRLMMAGLNHEGTEDVEGDLAIDLEVTSNRADCLCHLGVAREVAVLWNRSLTTPDPQPPESSTSVDDLTSVQIECEDLCPRFTARVIRGVTVGPSPSWIVRRLGTLGVASVNNIVDISNYVMLEGGRPLHTFDLDRLAGSRIVVRRANRGERLEAINHKTYELSPEMCVIADAEKAVSVGGIMGGAGTEVNERTRNLLIECAEFDPVSIRNSARALTLHSDSSYRFERAIDPEAVDGSSRRCCELILEIAGGELASGAIEVGRRPPQLGKVALRYGQLERILGISIDPARAREILEALGCRTIAADAHRVEVVPPSWRRDLVREIDLVEEVARIYGYEEVPEDVQVPMAPSARSHAERVTDRVRQTMTACGFDEATTLSVTDENASASYSPWTDDPPLVLNTPILRGADRLRRTLVPSLLAARRTNESLSNPRIELFEIAKVYLPRVDALPDEQSMLAISSGGDFRSLKGAIEAVLETLHVGAELVIEPLEHELFEAQHYAGISLAGQRFGFIGQIGEAGLKRFELRGPACIAELKLGLLIELANLVPKFEPLPTFPAVRRDLNLVVDENVTFADLSAMIREGAGPLLEQLAYRETYRSDDLGDNKKSILLALVLRDAEGTLTGEQADELCQRVVAVCGERLGAQLRM